jgi:hypothetical protein
MQIKVMMNKENKTHPYDKGYLADAKTGEEVTNMQILGIGKNSKSVIILLSGMIDRVDIEPVRPVRLTTIRITHR